MLRVVHTHPYLDGRTPGRTPTGGSPRPLGPADGPVGVPPRRGRGRRHLETDVHATSDGSSRCTSLDPDAGPPHHRPTGPAAAGPVVAGRGDHRWGAEDHPVDRSAGRSGRAGQHPREGRRRGGAGAGGAAADGGDGVAVTRGGAAAEVGPAAHVDGARARCGCRGGVRVAGGRRGTLAQVPAAQRVAGGLNP